MLISINTTFISRSISLPLVVPVVMAILIVVLIAILWSVKRRREPELVIDQPGDFDDAFRSIAGLTQGECIDGNEVKILHYGDGFFPVVIAELEKAKHSIHFETFLWKEGKLSNQITSALAAAAKRDVNVRLLLDGQGGKITKAQRKKLTDAGAQVRFFHPWRLSNIGRMNNRDHRKIVIIDGRTAFVGGHCIVDTWLGHGQDKKHFSDVSVRLRGPAVHAVQSTFSENWIEETGDVFVGSEYFPALKKAGDCEVHAARITTAGSSSSVKLLHYLVIECAQESIRIQNPYFLPDPQGIEALCRAVARGVDVRIMIPAVDASDNLVVGHASHHKFGSLLKGGVKIYQYQRTLLHQKVLTVDHIWSAVGSTNFDDRSFELNDEVTLGIRNEEFAAKMEKIFEDDLEACEEVHLDAWKNRPLWHKTLDGMFFLINEQL